MANDKLKIELEARKDGNGKTYYLGKLKIDATLNLKDGQVFLVFVSEPGCEQLQIGPMDVKADKDKKRKEPEITYKNKSQQEFKFTDSRKKIDELLDEQMVNDINLSDLNTLG